jgi:hypothetical protein
LHILNTIFIVVLSYSLICSCKNENKTISKTVDKDSIETEIKFNESDVWGLIDSLNLSLQDSNPKTVISKLFYKTYILSKNKHLISDIQILREKAYKTKDFDLLTSYVKRGKPLLNIIVASEGTRIGPYISTFLELSGKKSIDNVFFTTANDGWCDSLGNTFGGEGEFPIWLEKYGYTEIDTVESNRIIMKAKWDSLLNVVDGFYKRIATYTCRCLEPAIAPTESEINIPK